MSKHSPVIHKNTPNNHHETKHEIKCANQQVIVTRTDLEGNLIYYNPTFLEINAFSNKETLIRKPHNIVRHPDMPKSIFHIIWTIIERGHPIQAIVKNKTQDNHYYWSVMNWKVQFDNNNNIISYVAYAKQAPEYVIKAIEPLYGMMLQIEKEHGMESALEYLHSFLNEENLTYSQYLKKLTKHREIRCLCDFVKHKILRQELKD
jgi:hypothetical protein